MLNIILAVNLTISTNPGPGLQKGFTVQILVFIYNRQLLFI